MPSAIEIYDEKQRAFDQACVTLDELAKKLLAVADVLKNRDALLKPPIRYPIEDDGAVGQRLLDEEEYVALDQMPTADLTRSAIMNLKTANFEREKVYATLSEIEKRYADHERYTFR